MIRLGVSGSVFLLVCVCVCIFFNAWRKLVNFFTYLNESISYNSVYLTLACVKIFE